MNIGSVQVLQSAATANGNGTPVEVDGQGYQAIHIKETAGGTVTAAIQGSIDGSDWFAVGYQQIDNTAAPARAVANISVLANGSHVFEVLDRYPQIRVVLSAIAGSASVTVKSYSVMT